MPVGTTLRRLPRPVLTTGHVLLLCAGLLVLGAAAAGAAAAVDDPSRPDAVVTHGPSCRPGGVVVEVTAGTAAYAVTLATTRRPAGEDRAEVPAGETVVLRTGDVDWGETIDSRLEYAALDGSGTAYTDELEGFSYTRPAEEDCAAIAALVPPADATPAPSPTPTPTPATPAPEPTPAPGPGDLPLPGLPEPSAAPGPPADGPIAGGPAVGAVSASTRQVPAGGEVVLTGSGFAPGEQVIVRGADGGVLASAEAGLDGTVSVAVRIPAGVATGPTTVQMAGADSAVTAAVRLRVAAAAMPADPDPLPVPLVSAGLALLVSATVLVLAAARQVPALRPPRATGSA